MSTVLTLLTSNEQATHRALIQQWLDDNHIETNNLAPGWISIERDEEDNDFIRYHAFKRDTTGHTIPDPDGRNQSWIEERTTPLDTKLPDLTTA